MAQSNTPSDIVSIDSCWERSPDVMGFPSGEDYALHDMETDEYYVLPGRVATIVWDLCDGVTPVSVMVEKLESEFDANQDTVLVDLQEFLSQLFQLKLINTVV